jgi:diaminohydroxyphosphoribosylaminopyrimidine deaminase/5-amino-6-(5-phosphoribosylamino)uracil reductase
LPCQGDTHAARLDFLLAELARRGMTNVLFEGGAQVFGCLVDHDWLDEMHVFVSPRLAGGAAAVPAVAGLGRAPIDQALRLAAPKIEVLEGDLYIHGRVERLAALSTAAADASEDLVGE